MLKAARDVCSDKDTRDLGQIMLRNACLRGALQSARTQVAAAALAAGSVKLAAASTMLVRRPH